MHTNDGTAPPDVAGVAHDWIRVNDLDVHVAVAGPSAGTERKRPVVLVHGWPQHWWCWRDIIGPLASDRQVIAIDLRGQGWTSAPATGYDKRTLAEDLFATIRAMGLGTVDLVGHDWGGWVGLLLAQHHPEVVNRVVGLAIPAPWARVPRPALTLPRLVHMPLAGGPLGPVLHRRMGQPLIRLVLRLGTGDRRRRDLEPYLERYRIPERARAGTLLYRTFLRREAPAILRGRYSPHPPPHPVLLIAGARDIAISPSLVRASSVSGADVTVETLRGVGHMIPEERADYVVERVREFFDREDHCSGLTS